MTLGLFQTILNRLNEWVEPFHAWVDNHHDNPLMWLGFFVGGLVMFFITYEALSKNH